MNELKPCPFCGKGGENLMLGSGRAVFCRNCRILGPEPNPKIITAEVINAWNTRKETAND